MCYYAYVTNRPFDLKLSLKLLLLFLLYRPSTFIEPTLHLCISAMFHNNRIQSSSSVQQSSTVITDARKKCKVENCG